MQQGWQLPAAYALAAFGMGFVFPSFQALAADAVEAPGSDAQGDGDWYVAIRCARLQGTQLRLYAGAGIVAESHPEAEVAEPQRSSLPC